MKSGPSSPHVADRGGRGRGERERDPIENEEQFEAGALHQCRTHRRGAHASFCIVMSDVRRRTCKRRLKILEATTMVSDCRGGFEIERAGELLGQNRGRTIASAFRRPDED